MASSNITLSAGVRQNLLSLQSTAQLMSMTQNRLATGKKVNSALDNPVNFFTSSSLHARANDLSTLLDSMSNGIKTLEAADNALTSITNTVQSMQSTLRQARQDKSFKTNSYTVALGTTPAGTEQLSFTGGAVGATAVNIALTSSSTTAATNALVTGTSALSSISTGGTSDTNAILTGTTALSSIDTNAATNAVAAGTSALASIDASGGAITFEVNGDLVTLADNGGTNSDGIYTADDIVDAINTQVGTSASVNAALDTNGNLVITSTGTAGALDEVTVDTFSAGDATQLGFAGASVTENGSDGADVTFDVNGQTVTLAQSGGTGGVWSATQIRDAINTQVGTSAGVAATLSTGGNLVLTSTGTAGASDTVTVDNFSAGDVSQLGYVAGASATDSGADGTAAADLTFDINGQTVTLASSGGTAGVWSAGQIRDAINTQVGSSASVAATLDTSGNLVITSTGTAGLADTVTVDNFSSGDATQLGFAGATATDAGTDEVAGTTFTAKSVDQLVVAINGDANLTGKIVASNDNGKLRIQNLSTADLTVAGLDTSGAISGGTGNNTVGGNDVRKTLVSQFNTLLDQLNKTADDASYNGINLLRSDKLKLTLNETGTSTLEIQALDTNGTATSIDAAYLKITGAVNSDFDSDATLDSRLDTLATSLTTLRAQASSFGSNLSIVQNRQDFTKAMITTLQTGGDNLILADTNEEGANLLALQTRQQLSTTALSLSAQADQAVLRLF